MDLIAHDAVAMQDKVKALEDVLLAVPQIDCPVRHHFAPGMYAREISIPKGTVLTGAVHKTQNLAILSQGKLQLVTDDGTIIITAPHILTVIPRQSLLLQTREEGISGLHTEQISEQVQGSRIW